MITRVLYCVPKCRIFQKTLWNLSLIGSKTEYRPFGSLSRAGFDDYDKERASWNVTIPEKFNFASDVIDVWARKEREGTRNDTIPAFWFVSESGEELKWNYQQLEIKTKRVANMLQEKFGLKRGENVIVMLPKVPEFWLVNVAAIRIGLILSPSSMMLTLKDLSYRLSVFPPSCIIAHESVIDLIDEVCVSCPSLKAKIVVSNKDKSRKNGWHDFHRIQDGVSADHKCSETKSDESLMVFFTSGTTGQPKMAEHSHSSYGIGHNSTGKYLHDITSENILWNISDTGWAKTACSGIFSPWARGACAFISEMPRFSTSLTLQLLSKFPIDTLCAPPMAFRALIQEDLKKYKFCKLSHCVSGGEPLTAEVIKQWEAGTGLKIYEAYGQTESIINIGMFKCIKYKPGSMGKPLPGIDVVILDENENELGPGVHGEIALKRKKGNVFGLFKGYKDEPEKTQKCLTEKYFHTGDIAYYDEDGYFWFVGRNDDLINSAGYRIGPFEVESALMEHPSVLEVVVTSSPDTIRGEVVKAFIVLKDAYLEKSKPDLINELQEHTKKITAPYKYPRKIEFVKELPKTISGKIKRFELKSKEWRNHV